MKDANADRPHHPESDQIAPLDAQFFHTHRGGDDQENDEREQVTPKGQRPGGEAIALHDDLVERAGGRPAKSGGEDKPVAPPRFGDREGKRLSHRLH